MDDRPDIDDAPDRDGPGGTGPGAGEPGAIDTRAYDEADDLLEQQLEEINEKLGSAIRTTVRSRPGIEIDDLVELLGAQLVADVGAGGDGSGSRGGPGYLDSYVDLEGLVTELLYSETYDLCDQHGPLIETADGKLLDLAHMVTNKVFTHRVSAIEAEEAMLICDFDLWPLSGFETLRLDADSIGSPGSGPADADDDRDGDDGDDDDHSIEVSDDPYSQRWSSPRWHGAFTAGETIAVSVDEESRARITLLPESPTTDRQVLESFRGAYELHCEATDLPPSADLLTAEMLLDEPSVFDEPTAPLSQYAEELGLEIRLALGADAPSQWRTMAAIEREARINRELGAAIAAPALEVLRVADRIAAGEPSADDLNPVSDRTLGDSPAGGRSERDRVALRDATRSLTRAQVRDAVGTELFVRRRDSLPGIDARPFLDAALESAQDPGELAAIHFMRHSMAVHDHDLPTAEAELRQAMAADPDFPDAVDQLAWFASLRGDATTAVGLWRRLEPDRETTANLAVVAPLTTSGHKPGRNEPCWCGSGRKYKKCHIGEPPVPSLSERVQWLWHKAVTAPETTTTGRVDHAVDVALARTAHLSAPASIRNSVHDPLTQDLAFNEGGFCTDFLEVFGSALPDDERQLAETWSGVPRSVFEVTGNPSAQAVTMRDMRSGTIVEVASDRLPAGTHDGQLICARVVPAGNDPTVAGHQVVGGTFSVPTGSGDTLLAILDTARVEMSGVPIAEWLSKTECGTVDL